MATTEQTQTTTAAEAPVEKQEAPAAEATPVSETAKADANPPAESFRLRVANLAWGTTDEAFKEFFGKYSPTEAVIIRRKQTNRSRGYGFVTFADKDSMTKALEELDNQALDEREIKIAISTSKGPYPEGSKRPVKDADGNEVETTTKRLIVQRLAWDVDDEKLQAAFAKFGTVESAKVVKNRRSNRSRGYGFVTFSTEEEGKAAMEAMDNNLELGFKKEATEDQEAAQVGVRVVEARSRGPGTSAERKRPRRRRAQKQTDDGDKPAKAERAERAERAEAPRSKAKGRKRKARASGNQVQREERQERQERAPATVGPRRVFIRDLNETTSQETVQAAFEKYGKIKDVRLIMDRDEPEKSRGFAYVTYEEHEDFKKAIAAFENGGEVDGADVKVMRAFPSRQGGRGRGRGRRGRRRGRGGGRGRGRGAQTSGGDDGPTDL